MCRHPRDRDAKIDCRNAPDFASRAKYPAAANLPQLISVPLGFSIVSFIGIIVSSSSETIYGEAIWSPIDLLEKFLDNDPSHATRFGVCTVLLVIVRNAHLSSSVHNVGVVHRCCFHHRTGKLPLYWFRPQLQRFDHPSGFRSLGTFSPLPVLCGVSEPISVM